MTEPSIHYDEPSDTLYISFGPAREATGLELNDHLLLRIDWQGKVAIGLTIVNYSLLAQPTEIGPRSFALTGLAEMPASMQELALSLLQAAPLREFLALSAYTPTGDPADIVPIAVLRSERVPPRAA